MGGHRDRSQRLIIANETKTNCIEHDLENEVATRILFTMLDNYVERGTTYIGKELRFALWCDRPRKYVINLHNDISKKDTVLIRIDDSGSGPGSRAAEVSADDDDECPELV